MIKNPEDVNTLVMINEIALNHHKKIYNSIILGYLIKFLGSNFSITRKMFGNIYYEKDDSKIDGFTYRKMSFKESIKSAEINKA